MAINSMPWLRFQRRAFARKAPRPASSVTAKELRQFAIQNLPAHKVPTQIVIIPEIPKGPTGKLMRIGLYQKLADYLKTDYTAPGTETEIALAVGSPLSAWWMEFSPASVQ